MRLPSKRRPPAQPVWLPGGCMIELFQLSAPCRAHLPPARYAVARWRIPSLNRAQPILHSVAGRRPHALCTALLGGTRKLIARPCRVVLACLLHGLAVLYPLAFCTASSRGARMLFAQPCPGGARLLFARPCRAALACFLHGLAAWRSHAFCTALSGGVRLLFAQPSPGGAHMLNLPCRNSPAVRQAHPTDAEIRPLRAC